MTKRRLLGMHHGQLIAIFDKQWHVNVFVSVGNLFLKQPKDQRQFTAEDIFRCAIFTAGNNPPDTGILRRIMQWALDNNFKSLMDIPESILLGFNDNPFQPPIKQEDAPIGGTLFTGVADNFYGS